ncbi:hypothetical protein [Dictyobacter arantiisoli]|uniref:hypothetical protein n=1 Tax=Dictyobacter arantiisoli TaxID=2014874 RepID=UPI0011EF6F4F|nr:hypothetical protein [Dictyobacter arantiisoli]
MKLKWFGSWIPVYLGSAPHDVFHLKEAGFIEWMVLLACMTIAYALAAFFIYRQAREATTKTILAFIFGGVIIAALLYLFTPAMVTTDIFSYENYGRLLSVHAANPYFVPPNAYQGDVSLQWVFKAYRNVVSIYGPIWTLVSSLLSGFSITQMGMIIVFRGFAILCHLANIVLVIATLRMLKRSPRVVLLGAFLYAWNPLVLLEACMSGHNDVFMAFFMLLGLYFCARGERKGTFTQWRSYIPAILAFTASALVKFSSAPLLIIFVLALFFAKVHADSKDGKLIWRPALVPALLASCICIVFALALYAPFYSGHSVQAIISSVTNLPSATQSQNSILATFFYYNEAHRLHGIVTILNSRKLWNILNIVGLLLPIMVGCRYLWRTPDTRTIALVTLASLGGFLLTSPWFFSWYLVWVMILIPFCLPVQKERLARALLAFGLSFSITCFLAYYTSTVGWRLAAMKPASDSWSIWQNLGMFVIPLLAFLIFWFYPPRNARVEQELEPQAISAFSSITASASADPQ